MARTEVIPSLDELGAIQSLNQARLALRNTLCAVPKEHPDFSRIVSTLNTVNELMGR